MNAQFYVLPSVADVGDNGATAELGASAGVSAGEPLVDEEDEASAVPDVSVEAPADASAGEPLANVVRELLCCFVPSL